MKIKLVVNENGAHFWRLLGANGEILANSEAYSSKSAAAKTASKVAGAMGLKWDKAKGESL